MKLVLAFFVLVSWILPQQISNVGVPDISATEFSPNKMDNKVLSNSQPTLDSFNRISIASHRKMNYRMTQLEPLQY